MSVKAYVLVVADPGKTANVVSTLRQVQGVKVVSEVTGPYDIVVELQVAQLADLTELLRQRIRPVDGIRNTVTCVAMG